MSAEEPRSGRATRVTVALKVKLKLPDRATFVERFAHNISRTGIFIRARDSVAPGSRVRFEYRLADDSKVLRGMGIVRWARSAEESEASGQPPGMGIEFVDVDAATDRLITEIVNRFGEGERAPKRTRRVSPRLTRDSTVDSTEGTSSVQLDHKEEALLDALDGPTLSDQPRLGVPLPEDAPAEATPEGSPRARNTPAWAAEPPLSSAVSEAGERPATVAETVAYVTSSGEPVEDLAPTRLVFDLTGAELTAHACLGSPEAIQEFAVQPAAAEDSVPLKSALRLLRSGPGSARGAILRQRLHLPESDLESRVQTAVMGAARLAVDMGPCEGVTLVMPTSAYPIHDTLGRWYATEGATPNVATLAQLITVMDKTPGPHLVIEVEAYDTTISWVAAGGKLEATAWDVGAGLHDADLHTRRMAAVQLMVEHEIDVHDDPSLETDLLQQIVEFRRSGDLGPPWEVSIAGAPVLLETTQIEAHLAFLTERVLIRIDEILEATGGSPRDVVCLVASLESTWLGLMKGIRERLGVEVRALQPDRTSLLRGAAKFS